jgi:hypothetical protein
MPQIETAPRSRCRPLDTAISLSSAIKRVCDGPKYDFHKESAFSTDKSYLEFKGRLLALEEFLP